MGCLIFNMHIYTFNFISYFFQLAARFFNYMHHRTSRIIYTITFVTTVVEKIHQFSMDLMKERSTTELHLDPTESGLELWGKTSKHYSIRRF